MQKITSKTYSSKLVLLLRSEGDLVLLVVPKLLCGFLRLHYLWCYSLSPQKAPASFQEAPRKLQKFQGKNPYNILIAILVETMLPKRHFKINWPLATTQAASYKMLKFLGRYIGWRWRDQGCLRSLEYFSSSSLSSSLKKFVAFFFESFDKAWQA